MKRLLFFVLFLLIPAVLPGTGRSIDCEDPDRYEDVRTCLAIELRDSDAKINDTYRALMQKSDEAGKKKLRNDQRTWLKTRDSVCNLDSTESDREKWMQAILQNQRKTVCVIRFTRQRVSELTAMVARKERPVPEPKPAPVGPSPARITLPPPEQHALYEIHSPMSHSKGKWYFEAYINRGAIAKVADATFAFGIMGSVENFHTTVNVRRQWVNASPVRLGIAVDLDNGKYYSSVNGAWKDAPGSAGGMDVKLGRSYRVAVESSVSMAGFTRDGIIQVNFGEQPFAYAMPAGYRPFAER